MYKAIFLHLIVDDNFCFSFSLISLGVNSIIINYFTRLFHVILFSNCLKMFTKFSYSKTLFFKLSRINLKPINAHRLSYEFVRYKSDEFIGRHIGPRENDKKIMLESIGYKVHEFCIITIIIIII